MKVIVVANQKGGVGKSTISCNLAVAAAEDGKKVLVIDADPQGSSMEWRAQREKENVSVIAITTKSIIKEISNFDNFDLVIVDAGGRDNVLLRAAVTTAAHGILLIPALASAVDIWATQDTFNILEETRATVAAVGAEIPAYVVFNQLKPNASLIPQAKEALDEITQGNDVILLDNRIGDREDFKKAFLNGMGVVEYAPKSKAAAEIKALYETLKTII